MNKILCKISDEDAKRLTDTIIEVEMCKQTFDESTKKVDYSADALRMIFDYYIHSLKVHKNLWVELLIKYIGEEETSTMFYVLRFDTVKKVIFQMEIEGCALCKE